MFSSFNLLAGVNGSGKSSLLQSILVLSQTLQQGNSLKKLTLNGHLVELGSTVDIRNSATPRNEPISLSFSGDGFLDVAFQITESSSDQLLPELRSSEDNSRLLHTLKRVHFISADRLGPRNFIAKTNLPEFLNVGEAGQYTHLILGQSENLPNVSDSLCLGNDSKNLRQQTSEWLNYVFGGAKIEMKGSEDSSSVVQLRLNSRSSAHSYRPTSVGSGYSFALPIIVAGLIARKGEVLIIENPEAHLHTGAQSRITEFLAKVAIEGVQVFIESHSENVLHATRIAIKNDKLAMTSNDVSVLFFSTRDSDKVHKIEIKESGAIEQWPDDFFDQTDRDLERLFGI